MTQHTGTHDTPLERSPQLEKLLREARQRLQRQVWIHGIGTVLSVGVLWLGFAYLADWGLRVPHAVRLFHALVLVAVAGYFAWRDLLRPLSRLPRRDGLAVLFERAHPELKELFVSAVQLQGRAAGDGDPTLVQRIVAEADRRASELTPAAIIDPRAPRKRLYLGLSGLAISGLFLLLAPAHARIFFDHLVGGTTPWPQRTNLVLELPGIEGAGEIERSATELRLRIARGTDIPILIHAEGVVPDVVTLHFEGGRDLFLTSSGGNVFRTLLRSCQEDVTFHATGGDDNDGEPRVLVEVLQPPDIEGVAVAITPPAYSGLAPSVVFNRDVDVLAGSRLRVHVLPSPPEAVGVVRILPEDATLALEPFPFPVDPAGAIADGAPSQGLAFEFLAEESIGFRIELVDEKGLENPDPGLFRVRVSEDRAPELAVLAPSRTEFEVVQGGAIPLRLRAEDDFGLVDMGWRARRVGADEEAPPVASGTLGLFHFPGEEATGPRKRALAGERIEVNALGSADAPVSVDQRFTLEVFASDNREPVPNTGRALPIRARIVTPEELLRRMQDRLSQARLSTVRLFDLQTEKRTRVEELLESLEGDETLDSGDSVVLNAVLSGERRVLADAQTLARDLASVAEDILYARLDDKADTLLELFDRRMRDVADLRFQAEPWRDLSQALAEGRAGTPGFAGTLVELVALSLEVSEDHVRGAVDALAEAERAIDAASVQNGLLVASEHQTRALARIENLLDELAEWDNFQNILTLTRDILNRARALRDHTQQFASDK